jgi:hypothetical protein
MHIEFITNPWKNKFLDLVSTAKHSIKITSPFVKENICDEILSAKNKKVKLELITSFKLKNIHCGSLDIGAIEKIINAKGEVRNFSKLHSKIYIFDEEKAVVSSANLTNSGLVGNYEYGIYSNDKSFVSQVLFDFGTIFNNENTGVIKKSDINCIKKMLLKIPKTQSNNILNFKIDELEKNSDVIDIPQEIILSSLKGWKLHIFQTLNLISQQQFELKDIYKFERELTKIHANNFNVKHKIRQQLQFLRDLGLIEFAGSGIYRKLWR